MARGTTATTDASTEETDTTDQPTTEQHDGMVKARAVAAETRDLRKDIEPYLDYITRHGANRGGIKRDPERIRQRLRVIEQTKESADALHKVLLIQEELDLTYELETLTPASEVDVVELEVAFIKAVPRYSELKGVSYTAWRAVGVPPKVLVAAGIPETRRLRRRIPTE